MATSLTSPNPQWEIIAQFLIREEEPYLSSGLLRVDVDDEFYPTIFFCNKTGHALDVFDNYPQLLMEMALRLPCQIHKHCDPGQFDARWRTLLCEYMMNQQTPLRYESIYSGVILFVSALTLETDQLSFGRKPLIGK